MEVKTLRLEVSALEYPYGYNPAPVTTPRDIDIIILDEGDQRRRRAF